MILDKGLNAVLISPLSATRRGRTLCTIFLREPLGLCWEDEIVRYRLPRKFRERHVDVFWNGVAVPCQASGDFVSFIVEALESGEARQYSVEPAKGHGEGRDQFMASLTRVGQQQMCLSNGLVSFLLPGNNSRGYGENDAVPGPVIAARMQGGRWLGKGHIESPFAVRSVATSVVESGRLWTTVKVVYRFEGGYSYEARITLRSGEMHCEVEENSTLPVRLWPTPRPYREIGSLNPSFWRQGLDEVGRPCVRPCPTSNFILELGPGLRCDRMITHSTGSWEIVDMPLRSQSLKTYTAMRPALPFIDGAWMGVYNSRRCEMIGVVALDIDQWRAPDTAVHPAHRTPGVNAEVILVDSKSGGTFWRFPIENVRRRWLLALLDREHAGKVTGSARTGRKPVRLDADPHMPLWNLHRRRAALPLDKVKDWITEWRDAGHEHPRLFFAAKDIEAIRKKVHEAPELWENYRKTKAYHPADRYLVEGIPAHLSEVEAATHAMELVEGILARGYAGPTYGIGLSRPLRRYAAACDVLWDCFSEQEKREVRRVCALAAYILTDGRWWQYAYRDNETTYLPNFNSDVFTCAGLLGLFLSDHPCSGVWTRYLVRRLDEELARHVRDDGCGEENVGCYYPHTVYALYLPAMWALRQRRVRDYSSDPRLRAAGRFFLDVIEPPNSRDHGRRQLPPVGDHPYARKALSWAPWLAAFLKERDPELAGHLMWAWRATGSFVHRNHDHSGPAAEPLTLHYIFHDPSIREIRPCLTSRFLPNVGAVLRSHDTSRKGSYVFFKAGRVHCHHEEDEGSFHYYARGVPMALDGLPLQNGTPRHQHNAVTFARPGQPTMNVECFSTTSLADYVRGRVTPRGFCSDTMYVDGSHRNGWEREIVLIKADRPGGVEYLVIKDAVCGPDECMWNLDVLSRKPAVRSAGSVWFPGHAGRGFGIGLDVLILEPSKPAVRVERGRVSRDVTNQRLRRELKNAAGGSGVRLLYDVVEHWLMHVSGPAGSTFLVVLFPRRQNEMAPIVRYLEREGTIEITHSEGSDLVFLRPNPAIEVNLEGVVFKGRAGIVRERSTRRRVPQALDAEYIRLDDYPNRGIEIFK